MLLTKSNNFFYFSSFYFVLQTLGVFDSLEKKYLQNIIFSIFADPENEMDAVEVYTFSFTYTENNKIKMEFSTSHVDTPLATETTTNTLSSSSMSYDSNAQTMKFFFVNVLKKKAVD